MLAPGTEVGRYVIKRKLAEGGMAEIFLASANGPEGFSKDVVIKVVRSFLARDSQFVQMFIAEARLVSRLNHANVVQIFDFGKFGESFYLAMEYVRGASLWDLRKRCRDHGVPFPPLLAAEIGAQVARGLQYAHGLTEGGQRIGVVHRDVTPHNVLLSFDGAVKLTDFGIAKATTTQTAPGMLKGKFAYMAPEQARGDKVDARTDLFALGIVVWELLTGGRLFSGDSDLAMLRAVQESLIAPPSRLNPDVPVELSDVVMKALARPPEERFQTAFEMEKALANYVLRNAKSVDDTSVSLFLQQMFREEFETPSTEQRVPDEEALSEDFGLGDTRARIRPNTVTATPVPVPLGAKTMTTPARPRGVMEVDRHSLPTEELAPAGARPRTEQMPAHKPSSRRLAPLPVGEPSIVVRPSVLTLPEVSASQTEKATPALPSVVVDEPVKVKSKAPRLALVALGVAALGVTLGYVWSSQQQPAAPVVAVAAKAEPITVTPPPPPVEQPEPVLPPAPVAAEPVGDAGLAEPPPSTPEPVKVVVARKLMGTLLVKAVPFATVLIQGKPYEVTGVQKLPAPAGTYEITLVHPKRRTKEKVTVLPNQVTSVSFSAE